MRIFRIMGLILIYLLLPVVSAEIQYTITPRDPVIGDTVNIEGTGVQINGFVYPTITFETDVEVNNFIYEYKISGIHIPSENYEFKLTANPVDELSINAKPEWLRLPIGLTYNGIIENNRGSMSYGHILISTNYDLKIYGKAHNNNKVNLKISNTAKIQSDSTGGFNFNYKTKGLPSGKYLVDISGRKEKIELKDEKEVKSTSILKSESTSEITNERDITAETPEIATASETNVADKSLTAEDEKKSILHSILDILKFWQ